MGNERKCNFSFRALLLSVGPAFGCLLLHLETDVTATNILNLLRARRVSARSYTTPSAARSICRLLEARISYFRNVHLPDDRNPPTRAPPRPTSRCVVPLDQCQSSPPSSYYPAVLVSDARRSSQRKIVRMWRGSLLWRCRWNLAMEVWDSWPKAVELTGIMNGPPVSEHHLAAHDLLPCAAVFGLSG